MNRGFTAASAGYVRGIVLIAALTVGVTGCHMMVDPFTDAVSDGRSVTTPSVESARAVETTRSEAHRAFAAMELSARDGTVTHGPLYFEDADEAAEGDDRFARTAQEYLSSFSWGGRFVLNLALFPISAMVTPPWMVMASDGYPSREVLGAHYDAEPWTERMDDSSSPADGAAVEAVGTDAGPAGRSSPSSVD